MDSKMMILGDEELMAVSGGHGKHKGKSVEQTMTFGDQNQSVDIGGDLKVTGHSSVTINFAPQTETGTQSA
jgi:hypothetical protein